MAESSVYNGIIQTYIQSRDLYRNVTTCKSRDQFQTNHNTIIMVYTWHIK